MSSSGECPILKDDEGPGYRSDSVFNLSSMQPYGLLDILRPFQQLTQEVIVYLPRTSDLRQLAKAADNGRNVTVVHYCMEGASKVSQYQYFNIQI